MSKILERLANCLKVEQLDALIAMSGENFRYLTNTQAPSQANVRTRHAIAWVTRREKLRALVVDIDAEYVRSNGWLEWQQITAYNEFTQKPIVLLTEQLQQVFPDLRRIAIELDFLPARDYLLLVDLLPGVEIVDATPLFMRMRKEKLAHEIALLETFGRAVEGVVQNSFQNFRLGMSERDLERLLADGFRIIGGDRLTMTTVASGEKSCLLNSEAGDRIILCGDVVRVDMIGTKQGYCCDVCRTFVAGEAQEAHYRIWQHLVEIHYHIVGQLRPGVWTRSVYQDYAQSLTCRGYQAINFVGHGLGMSLHEEPFIDRYGDNVLQKDMTLCIEPICIVEGRYGFQLENGIVLTEEGCRMITGGDRTYRKLPVLGL